MITTPSKFTPPCLPILALLLLTLQVPAVRGQWYKSYDEAKPPSYLQPPWASAPGFADAPLPVAPKPMAPPPPPPQGFQGAGRFYPPPPPPPPSPPPPLPPPPPAPAVNFPAVAAGTNTSPHLVAQASAFLQLSPVHYHRLQREYLHRMRRGRGGRGGRGASGRTNRANRVHHASRALDRRNIRGGSSNPHRQVQTYPSLLEVSNQIKGDGKGMMSFQYYDANNKPPWLTPPWNVEQPGGLPAGSQLSSNQPGMPPPSYTQGSAPAGGAPIMSVPMEYNPAQLKQLPNVRL